MASLIRTIREKRVLRRAVVIGAHAALYAVAFLIAFLLRFDLTLPSSQERNILVGVSAIVVLRTGASLLFRLHSGVLKYAGINDLVDIIKAMSIASVALVVLTVLLGLRGFPRSVIFIDWLLAIMLVGGLRFGLRLMREALIERPTDADRKRVLILGAGDAGEALVRDLLRTHRSRYEVVGFLDDNREKLGLRIHDVPVMGPLMYLGDIVPRYHIDEVIIAIPTATGKTMRRIVDIAKVAGVRFKTIPGVDQLIDGRVSINQIRDVAIEDLLGREPVHLEEGLLQQFLRGKAVMVTGAGGSIGSEMCRQITRYSPRKLILVEQAEPFLFHVHQELLKAHPGLEIVPVIADVTDPLRLEGVFSKDCPEVIFHAAAHKHVPMMEWNPGEAIKNNVFGTKTMADMANLFAAQAFVMISTDKAVNPTSVMGASKRVAEMYVQSLSAESPTKFTAVRFGNVLGSVGSVVPIFKQQIAQGGPVTVTHPDMRRYFMTIPEACQLVMQAAAMGDGGEIFVLDMGEPVKIVDLARDLITLSGFEPGREIEIKFTGLRPGEKLFEELGFDAEKMSKTRHPKVFVGKLARHSHREMLRRVEFLLGVANHPSPETIKGALKAVVPEFDSPAPPMVMPALSDSQDMPIERKPAEPSRAEVVLAEEPAPAPDTAAKPSETQPTLQETPQEALATPPEAPRETPASSENELLEPIWKMALELCQERGFAGVAWATMGVRPADRRRKVFNGGTGEQHNVMRRSVPLSALAFLEISFFYRGAAGRRSSDHVRNSVREITGRLTKELHQLGRETQPKIG